VTPNEVQPCGSAIAENVAREDIQERINFIAGNIPWIGSLAL
jgi:hypothetical protein